MPKQPPINSNKKATAKAKSALTVVSTRDKVRRAFADSNYKRRQAKPEEIPYKGQGLAETSLYIDKIAEKVRRKTRYHGKITITLTNGDDDTSIIVDVSNEAEFGKLRPFQFIAKDYDDVSAKLAKCFKNYIDKTGHDPLG